MAIDGMKVVDLDSHLVGDLESWDQTVEDQWRSFLPKKLPTKDNERRKTLVGNRVMIGSELGRQKAEKNEWFKPEDLTPQGRVRNMDLDGIDVAVLSPNSPALDILWFVDDPELAAAYARAQNNYMKKDGFDVQVLIPDNRMLIYELDAELGRQLARAYNETTAEDISGDDRFIGCAWIYLPDIQESIRELRRAVQDLGMKAVKFSGGWADGDLDNEVLWPLYEEIARLDIPILVHPGARVFEAQHSHPWLVGAERYQGFPHFPTALGFPLTYMVSAARLIFSGVLDRFPTLKFAFFEGGIGWVPWLMHTLNAHTPDEAGISTAVKQFFDGKQKLKKAPSEYFDQFYIAAVSWETYLPETIKGWPKHNIIIGSDFDHGDAVAT